MRAGSGTPIFCLANKGLQRYDGNSVADGVFLTRRAQNLHYSLYGRMVIGWCFLFVAVRSSFVTVREASVYGMYHSYYFSHLGQCKMRFKSKFVVVMAL